jgi:magnesium-transporting ATPase (P-type)
VTTDAPATVADRPGPDPPIRHAPAGSISARSPAEVFDALESSPQGLAAGKAASRLAALGPNELRAAKRPPVIKKVLAQFTNLFALVLLGASVITFASYLIQSPRDTGSLELAVAILAVVLLNGAIGFFQEYSAEKTSEALQALVPHTARVRRDGALADIPARGIVRGDVFVLEAGDDICCDGRLVEAHDLTVDDVALTGESAPVHRTAETVPAGTATMDAANLVFMGTSVVEGTATAVAFATGAETQFGQIYQMTTQVTEVASPLQRNVNRMAKQVSAVAVALAALVFGLRTATTSAGLVDSFVFALGVMVALVPEGLPATLSVSLAIAVRRMATRHALIKRLAAVETLGSTTVICTDKTGTSGSPGAAIRSPGPATNRKASSASQARSSSCSKSRRNAATPGCSSLTRLASGTGASSGTPPRVPSSWPPPRRASTRRRLTPRPRASASSPSTPSAS